MILRTGREIAAGVVVRQNEAAGSRLEGGREDDLGIGQARGPSAGRDAQTRVALVEQQDLELFDQFHAVGVSHGQ